MTTENLLFLGSITMFMALSMIWGFKKLPQERWQIFATIPILKDFEGNWKGLNLTYYGILSANAYAFAILVLMILLGSYHIPISAQMKYTIPILLAAVPASRIVAWIVEKKSTTFTVGGASFTAIVILPWVVTGLNHFSDVKMPLFCFLAAVSIAYTYGEALGRLACISFGCCYGKPLSHTGPITRKLFSKFHFVFHGKTKKAAYASNLDGEATIPIQAITSLIFTGAALIGTALFLMGYFRSAMMITIVVTQVWRVVSEFFRADYRGDSGFSAYQFMALIAVCYMVIVSILLYPDIHQGAQYGSVIQINDLFGSSTGMMKQFPDILFGLKQCWEPVVILSTELFWIFAFLYTGRSFVTGSNISFHVIQDKI